MALNPEEKPVQAPEEAPGEPEDPPAWEPDEPDELQMREKVTLVAVFPDSGKAESCAGALRESGLRADVTVFSDSTEGKSGSPESSESDSSLSTGVAIGAGIGATAGMLAATYVFPGLGAPLISASPTVTTLAGAGLALVLGGLTDGKPAKAGGGAVVAVQVAKEDAEQVRAVVRSFEPAMVREAAP